MTIEMYMKQGCRPAKVTYARAAGYRIDKVNWKFIVYREDGSEYRYTQNFDDVGMLVINGKEIPQCYWYDHEIKRSSTDMKEEMEKKMKDIKLFFNVWCPKTNDVLFILFKDGTRNYYEVEYNKIEAHEVCLYIEDVDGCYDKIAYAAIEDCAIGIKNPGESALSAIPEWFEERINEYNKKLKEDITMPERNVQELLEEFDTEELVEEVKRRKEDEAWYNKFEQGMYYKVRDMRKEDSAFVILRFVGFDEDYDEFAQFENVYDHYMLWVPNPKLRRCNIDNYIITKLRDGMKTE